MWLWIESRDQGKMVNAQNENDDRVLDPGG